MSELLKAMGSGVAGAAVLTVVHETARRFVGEAPRMDLLGMRAIDRIAAKTTGHRLPEEQLRPASLAGDMIANSLYYGLVGLPKPQSVAVRGAVLGLAAGIGALALPGPLGLGSRPSNRTTATQVMTVSWYLLGGLAAAGCYQLLSGSQPARRS